MKTLAILTQSRIPVVGEPTSFCALQYVYTAYEVLNERSLWSWVQVMLTNQFHFASKQSCLHNYWLAILHTSVWVYDANMKSLYGQTQNNYQVHIWLPFTREFADWPNCNRKLGRFSCMHHHNLMSVSMLSTLSWIYTKSFSFQCNLSYLPSQSCIPFVILCNGVFCLVCWCSPFKETQLSVGGSPA